MSIATYPEPSVEVQQPAWIDDLWGQGASATSVSDDTIGRLYTRMDAEYGAMNFSPGVKRTPLKEIHPI
jgi:hypothetical protein